MIKTIKLLIYINILGLITLKCQQENHESGISENSNQAGINKIKTRFEVPEGFVRIMYDTLTFAGYLQNLKLKPIGTSVYCFDGHEKANKVYAAVIEMDIGNKDLQQCADAIIRLRSEYLFKTGNYKDIHFNFTNGFNAEFEKWIKGYRITVNNNNVEWVKNSVPDSSYKSFRLYLDMVFMYAGTLSLSKELKTKGLNLIEPGDVFIKGGSPGHAVIVVDVAQNLKTGEKIFLLAQSYMPAQDIHVLINPNNYYLSPWYILQQNQKLKTPEWIFETGNLKSFY